jgi:hypothetical protein
MLVSCGDADNRIVVGAHCTRRHRSAVTKETSDRRRMIELALATHLTGPAVCTFAVTGQGEHLRTLLC